MTTKTLTFMKGETDLSEGIDLRNGRSNPFGWSTYEVWHADEAGQETKIADLYCGDVINLTAGYHFKFGEAP